MDFGLQLIKLAGSFALVLALLFALLYGLKRWGRLSQKSPEHRAMEVLSKQSFGPRHHLLLVKVPGSGNFLVGISPQNMSVLAAGDDHSETAAAAPKIENL